LAVPTGQERAVGLGRGPNTDYRKHEHLTEIEIEKSIDAAKGNRYGQRDATMILVAYRRGLRASEICELTWDAIDFHAATIHVTRKKHGQAATHQIRGDELRALRKLQKNQEPKRHSSSPPNVVARRSLGTALIGW
jgi:integrase